MQPQAKRWILIALIYFLLGVSLGVVMGASNEFTLKGVHVHINLLGWVSMTLTGLIYHFFPRAAASKLAHAHFWLYQLATPLMLAMLALYLLGHTQLGPVLGISSMVVLLAVFLFVLNVFLHRHAD